MDFTLSKIAGFFAYPSNDLIALACVGLALTATRFAHAGRACTAIAVLLLAVFGLSPASTLLMYPLEQRFPEWDAGRGAPNGIIVLGGAITATVSDARGTPALNEAGERLTVAAALARQFPAARIVYSGGNNAIFGGASEAEFGAQLLQSLGVAQARIQIENRSRNTVENALFAKALLAPKPGERWLLVTSAYHMPRCIGVFRRIGFPVEAYPVDWRTAGRGDVMSIFAKASDGLARADVALHEWIGLVVYRLTGGTSELIPGPR